MKFICKSGCQHYSGPCRNKSKRYERTDAGKGNARDGARATPSKSIKQLVQGWVRERKNRMGN